ncbi:hypothetical protein D3C86_2248570 [compost metagenome]
MPIGNRRFEVIFGYLVALAGIYKVIVPLFDEFLIPQALVLLFKKDHFARVGGTRFEP